MTGNKAPSARFFDIPELAEEVFQFAGPRTIRTLRLVCRLFRDRCSPFFFLTLDLTSLKSYPNLKRIANSLTKSSKPEDQWGILDHVHTLKLDWRIQFESASSAILTLILNQCRHLRHINIADPGEDSGGKTPSAPSGPLLLWPNFSEVGTPYWSIFSRLPLEGTLLSRLESLTIGIDMASPINLNGFFFRLTQSPAAQTLCSLSLLGKPGILKREFSFDAFQECVSALKTLAILRIMDLEILPSDFSNHQDIRVQLAHQKLQQRLRNRHDRCVALKVRTLAISGNVPAECKVPIMDLFPNVESLYLGGVDMLLDSMTEEQVYKAKDSATLFPNTALYASSIPARHGSPLNVKVIPFPRLKALGDPDLSYRFWSKSRFLQDWINRQLGFQLIRLSLHPQFHSRTLTILTRKAVTIKNLCIHAGTEQSSAAALASNICLKLEALEIRVRSIESAGVLLAAFKLSKKSKDPPISPLEDHPILDSGFCQEDLLRYFPWTGTLTRLSLASGVDSRMDIILETGCLEFMRAILRLSPLLADFEMFEWIVDLALFDGLGRNPMASQSGIVTATEKDGSGSTRAFEDERPHLRRLVLFQLQDKEKQQCWRTQLEFRFRFLDELVI